MVNSLEFTTSVATPILKYDVTSMQYEVLIFAASVSNLSNELFSQTVV